MGRPEVSRKVLQKAVGPGRETFLQTVLPNGDEEAENRFITSFREIYWDNCLNETTLYPGMERVLGRFSDRMLAVATNKPRAFTEKILNGLGIYRFFTTVVGPDDVTHAKPNPEMLLKILEETGCHAASALFVGDTVEDMKAGHSAGVTFCRAAYGYGDFFHLEKTKPDCILSKPADLLKLAAH